MADRKLYIDFVKIIAIFMVLFNHTGTNGYTLFTIARDSLLHPFYLGNAIFIKVAVPLFFMTSGALLLEREESYRTVFRKRFLRYLLVLLAGSAVAYAYTCLRWHPQAMSFHYFVKMLYTKNLSVAYWFLYAYLAYLLMLPLLRRLAKAMTRQDYFLMIGMYGFLRALPLADFLLWRGGMA